MFKKLKRKTLIINLSVLTILLITVFTILFLTYYNQVQRNINFDLDRLTDVRNTNIPPNDLPEDDSLIPDKKIVSFIILTDSSNNIVDSQSSFGIDENLYLEALNLAEDEIGKIELESSIWAYKVITLMNGSKFYGFIDITDEQEYLTNMIYTFITVFLGAFVVVYFISSYFSNKSIEQIKESFIKQKQFVANASHELKTPLAIISTNTDILLGSDKDNKWLKYIKHETNRMSKLTKDLLYLTKMSEVEAKNLDKQNINLSEVLLSTVLSFEALAFQKSITLEHNIEPEIYIDVCEVQFNQVLHILIDNAIKYSPEQGIITISLKTQHNYVEIKVTNTGEGISKEDMPYIFDRFYMGDKSRSNNTQSYGLGLSIAKTIIDNHGAKILCDSIPNNETTFTVRVKYRNPLK